MLFDEFLEYCKKANRGGQRLVDDPHVQELLTDLFIDAKVGRLLFNRTFWKLSHKITTYYEGSQNVLYWKTFLPKFAAAAFEILGPFALVTDPKWTILNGKMEHGQRRSLMTHGAGTPEAQKVVMARLLGLPGPRRR